MSAGTIALTNNSAAVTGTGTAFTTDLKGNDFIVVIVGGVTYTLGVKATASATSLTLITPYGGPTATGNAWTAVPNATLVGITAQVAADVAKAIRGLNLDKANWQQVYSGTGNITVTLPDGSTYSGPSWKYLSDNMATKVSGAVPINQGGTAGTTVASAKQNLGVGGIGLRQGGAIVTNMNNIDGLINYLTAFNLVAFRNNTAIPGGYYTLPTSAASIFCQPSDVRDTWFTMSVPYFGDPIRVLSGYGASGVSMSRTLRDSVNTTVDSNGFIKTASPIVNIFADGTAETNHESQGVTVSRMAVGEYLVEGCLGLNSDTVWGGSDGGFELPTDRNGQPLLWLDYEVNADGAIIVKTYHRTHDSSPVFARNTIDGFKNGDPIDIPRGRFISVRVEMPECSVFNRLIAEAAAFESNLPDDSTT